MTATHYNHTNIFLWKQIIIFIKVVDTVLVPAGMYRIGTYTSIKTPTFRTSLNTDRIGHTGQFQAISTNTKKKKKKKAFFFFF